MNVTYTNGTAKFLNANEYLEWYKTLSLEEARVIFAKVKDTQHQTYITPVWDAARDMLYVTCWCSHPIEETEEYKWPIQRDKYTEHLSEFIQMADTYHMPLRVGEWYENNFAFLYLGNPDKGIIVPDAEKYLEYIPEKDYGDISPAQLRAELAFSSTDARMAIIPADADALTQMLKSYEYYHGATIGILIRNGENLYLGWTDEERVHITDDLIVSQVITETEPAKPQTFYSSFERERWEEQQKKQRKQLIDGIISRSFVYNILQGVVEHTPLLPLPAGVTLGRQSEYVIYSVADMWITDNRFGSFTDIIERCNENITKGDPVLTVQRLRPERDSGYFRSSWSNHQENVRGRGWANRTHDCSVDDCTIYPVNFIEKDPPVRMLRYRWRTSPDAEWLEGTIEESKRDRLSDGTEREILGEYDYIRKTVFVSVEKEFSDAGARSNFEIYNGEYINLQYMNSVWLEYVICNKTLGNWRIGGEYVNYAYAIKYLKTALDFVRKREETEKANLDTVDPVITTRPDWQVALSEWKMAKGVRDLTPYQAKRFARYVTEQS